MTIITTKKGFLDIMKLQRLYEALALEVGSSTMDIVKEIVELERLLSLENK